MISTLGVRDNKTNNGTSNACMWFTGSNQINNFLQQMDKLLFTHAFVETPSRILDEFRLC